MPSEYRPPYLVSVKETGRLVELWSTERLPFEPKGWLKDMRGDLREALMKLECSPDEILHATYVSGVDQACDAENILFYNVGASYFARSSSNGLRFERAFSEPPPPPRLLKERVLHYQFYGPAKRQDGFAYWRSRSKLVQWEMSSEALGPSTSATSIWYWMKRGMSGTTAAIEGEPSRFGLSVTLHASSGWVLNPAALIKPLFDGIIAAFHSHDGSMLEQVSDRLARKLDVDASEVAGHLLSDSVAVLGSRRLVWPWGKSVQWNPADDRCVAAELLLYTGKNRNGLWRLSGELFELDEQSPTAPPEPSPPASA